MTVERDPVAVSQFVEDFAQVMVDAGMPRIASRILVALLATDSRRLSATELGDQLRASAGAVSQGVRYLAQLGLVARGREPGSRRDYVEVYADLWYQTITRRDLVLERWTASLREGAATLGTGTPAGARLAESVEFFDFMQKELHLLIERWEARPGARPAG